MFRIIKMAALVAITLACIVQPASADQLAPSVVQLTFPCTPTGPVCFGNPASAENFGGAVPNIACGPPLNTVAPALSGTGLPGNTLSVTPGTWQDPCASWVQFSYGWNGPNGSGSSYNVQNSDVGSNIFSTVTASDSQGEVNSAESNRITIGSSGPPPPPPDSQAPTMPGNLRTTGSTSTTVTVAWNASSDNVGVSGYGLYLAGNKLGTTTQTIYTFGGLACAASYTVGVDAFDAVGNRSQQASILITAGACSPPSGGGGGTATCTSTGVVVLYELPNYGGQCWAYGTGQSSSLGAADNLASSIKVAAGYVVTLFSDPNFGGGLVNTVTAADSSSWGSVGDNNASSLVVQTGQLNSNYESGALSAEPVPISYYDYFRPRVGCSLVGDQVNYTRPGRKLWSFGLRTAECWNGTNVTKVYGGEIVQSMNQPPFPLNLIQGWVYTQVSFQQGQMGVPFTIIYAQGKFEYCGFKFACLNTQQPWVRIELSGNGMAVCTTSAAPNPHTCARKSA